MLRKPWYEASFLNSSLSVWKRNDKGKVKENESFEVIELIFHSLSLYLSPFFFLWYFLLSKQGIKKPKKNEEESMSLCFVSCKIMWVISLY